MMLKFLTLRIVGSVTFFKITFLIFEISVFNVSTAEECVIYSQSNDLSAANELRVANELQKLSVIHSLLGIIPM